MSLPSPELLAGIGSTVIERGHAVAAGKPGAASRGRRHSFGVETDMRHPTDGKPPMDTAEACRAEIDGTSGIPGSGDGIRGLIAHVRHRAGLTGRRIPGEGTVPRHGKVHSVLGPHTRWISKGGAGVPVEPGVPVRAPGTVTGSFRTVRSCGRGAAWTWRSPGVGRRSAGHGPVASRWPRPSVRFYP